MTGRGGLRAVVAVAAALAVTAGDTARAHETGEGAGERQAMTYEIGVTTAGTFTPIAKLSFDSANDGTLVLGAPHPRTSHLVQVWTNLADRDSIRIRVSDEVQLADGSWTNTTSSVEVAKSDPGFPDAILRFIAHEYGFDSRP